MAEDFVAMVTAPAWRAQLASLLRDHLSPSTPQEQAAPYLENNLAVPARIVRRMMAPAKPKKRGRYARTEEQATQLADDIVRFLAVEHLLRTSKESYSAVCERVGKLLHVTRQAVDDGYRRGQRYFSTILQENP